MSSSSVRLTTALGSASTASSRSALALGPHISAFSARLLRISWFIFLRHSIASDVKTPCFSAFLLPSGAPEPAAPPCIRHRALPRVAGAKQGVPARVLAPQRGDCIMGPKLCRRAPLTVAPSRARAFSSPPQLAVRRLPQSGAARWAMRHSLRPSAHFRRWPARHSPRLRGRP